MSDKGSIDFLPWRAPEVEDSRDLRPVDAEAARKLAWEQGYADGYQIGIEAGTRDARQRMGYLHEILESLAKPFAELDEQVAEQLEALVRSVTERLVRREIELDRSFLRDVVEEGMEALPVSETQVSIAVNPDDAEFIQEHMERSDHAAWRVRADAQVSRGGCRISAGASRIDATVTTRLNRLIDSMLETQESGDAAT